MPKFTDSQLVILSTAARREGGAVLPLPRSLKIKGAAATRVLKSLIMKGLLAERPAAGGAAAWRRGEDGRRQSLVVTEAGLRAIEAGSDEGPGTRAVAPKTQPKRRNRRGERNLTDSKAATNRPSPAVRQGTKQALPIDLPKRRRGAIMVEPIVDMGGRRVAVARPRQKTTDHDDTNRPGLC